MAYPTGYDRGGDTNGVGPASMSGRRSQAPEERFNGGRASVSVMNDRPRSQMEGYRGDERYRTSQYGATPSQDDNEATGFAQRPSMAEVDVSRWDLPDHLLAESTTTDQPPSRSPPLRVNGPQHTLDDPTHSAHLRPRDSFSSPRVHKVSTSTTAAATLVNPISMRERASVHLDVIDGLQSEEVLRGRGVDDEHPGDGEGGGDVFGAESALERAERVRRLVEGKGLGDIGQGKSERRMSEYDRIGSSSSSGERERTRSGDSIASNSTLRQHTQPQSALSLSHEPRSANPLLVPLPASPMAGPLRARPAWSFSQYNVNFNSNPGAQAEWAGSTPDGPEEEEEDDGTPNPFALPPPPPELGSRFDPKTLDSQRRSVAFPADIDGRLSRMTIMSPPDDAGVTSPISSRRRRRLSSNQLQHGLGDEQLIPQPPIRVYDDIPTPEQYGRPLKPSKYSNPLHLQSLYQRHRQSHIRPKTLIMPAPLVDQLHSTALTPGPKVPEGFTLGAKPLPPGARSSILIPGPGAGADPAGMATGGSRPGMGVRMSTSQMTFRSSMYVDGEREGSDGWVGRAEEDGAYGLDPASQEVEGEEMGYQRARKPGKLYGTSLMDQLEARKTAMKAKQRVFTGDSRPAMMARTSHPPHSASLSSLQNPQLHGAQSDSHHPRRPLLQFDENGQLEPTASLKMDPAAEGATDGPEGSAHPRTGDRLQVYDRMSRSKSVFGVDEIWEKEMAKLKVIQEAEAREREKREAEEKAREEREEKRKGKKKRDKGKGTGKGKGKAVGREGAEDMGEQFDDSLPPGDGTGREIGPSGISPIVKIPVLPPTLDYQPEQVPAQPRSHIGIEAPGVRVSRAGIGDWESSDDDEEGTGSKSKRRGNGKGKRNGNDNNEHDHDNNHGNNDDYETRLDSEDDEEDVPLSRLARPLHQAEAVESEDDDEEEAIPLSRLRKPVSEVSALASNPILAVDTNTLSGSGSLGLTIPESKQDATVEQQPSGGGVEDDDVPLLLRQAHVKATAAEKDGDGDDVPLGVRLRTGQMSQYGSTYFHQGQVPPTSLYPVYPGQPQALYPGYGHEYNAYAGHGHGYGYGYQGYPSYPTYQQMPHVPAQYGMGMGMNPPMGVDPYGGMGMSVYAGIGMSMGQVPMSMPGPMGGPPNERAIDDWRKGVAVAPVSSAGGED